MRSREDGTGLPRGHEPGNHNNEWVEGPTERVEAYLLGPRFQRLAGA